MMIEVSDEVGKRLQEMAERRGLTVGLMVDILIVRDDMAAERNRKENADKFRRTAETAAAEAKARRKCTLKPGDDGWPPPGSAAELAELARKANFGSLDKAKTNSSARTKENLNAESASYISRMWDK